MSARYAQHKVDLVLDLIAEFRARPFPHEDSAQAISQLADTLSEFRNEFATNQSPKFQEQAGVLISEVLELVGAIGNSANVRNAFEMHGPFLALAQKLLADDAARLILTFEWQYIPYTYPQNYAHLPEFIVIGLPASEGSNALVLPAIGHELGHSLWLKCKLNDHFKAAIEREVSRAKARRSGAFAAQQDTKSSGAGGASRALDEPVENGLRQLQEFFCDFVGLYIFGQAYLDLFDYLLTPAPSKERNPQYPSVRARAQALSRNLKKLALPKSEEFADGFPEQSNPFDAAELSFLNLVLADEASSSKLADAAADKAFELCRQRGLLPPKVNDSRKVQLEFENGLPADNVSGLGAVVSGAWRAFKSKRFLPGKADQERIAYLNELTMKSIEILELQKLLKKNAA